MAYVGEQSYRFTNTMTGLSTNRKDFVLLCFLVTAGTYLLIHIALQPVCDSDVS